MTEQEAQRILDEHRNPPRFVRGGYRYIVGRDGRVRIDRAVGKSGKRWELGYKVDATSVQVHPDVKRALGV